MDNSLLPLKIFLENYAEALDKTLQAAYIREMGGEREDLPLTIFPFANANGRESILDIYPNRFVGDKPNYSDFNMELLEFLEDEAKILAEQINNYSDTNIDKNENAQVFFRMTSANPASLVLVLENIIIDHDLKCYDDITETVSPIRFPIKRDGLKGQFNDFDQLQTDKHTLPFSLQRLYIMALDAGGNISAEQFKIVETEELRQLYRPQRHSQYTALQLTH